MKPRNQKERNIVELNGRLRPLTTPQKAWALNNTIKHYGYRLKSGMCTCMKCGHEWLDGKPKAECPLRSGLFDPMRQNKTNPYAQNKNDPCRQNVQPSAIAY